MKRPEKLTVPILLNMQAGEIFNAGLGYQHDERYLWVAKRGNIHDWAVYVALLDNDNLEIQTLMTVAKLGYKLSPTEAAKLVDCDEEALKMYRE